MRSCDVFFRLVAAMLVGGCAPGPDQTAVERPALSTWAWAADLPADSAIFLPGLVSLPDRMEQGITFSPAGDTLVFSAIVGRRDDRNLGFPTR